MESQQSASVTGLLLRWRQGEQECLNQIIPLIQTELHRIAKRQMRSEPLDHTLQATALVNEAYLRLVDQDRVNWQDRAHFFAITARIMRQILVDYARRKKYAKRGGGAINVSLTGANAVSAEPAAEVRALNEALTRLEELDLQQARVVELRFFGGLTIKETADVMGLSVDMIKREWNTAKAWLYREMTNEPA